MIIASWLVSLDPKAAQAARQTLGRGPGREIRSKSGSRWLVLMTEAPLELEAIRRQLLDTPGVETAEPIASFSDEDGGLDLVRWNRQPQERAEFAPPSATDAGSAKHGTVSQDRGLGTPIADQHSADASAR